MLGLAEGTRNLRACVAELEEASKTKELKVRAERRTADAEGGSDC